METVNAHQKRTGHYRVRWNTAAPWWNGSTEEPEPVQPYVCDICNEELSSTIQRQPMEEPHGK